MPSRSIRTTQGNIAYKQTDIFLLTFTENAAVQLKDVLHTLLGFLTNEHRRTFDISKMALCTAHSICQSIIADRRFAKGGARKLYQLLKLREVQ